MENASKALIMAASVLIAIMVLSLGVYLFSIFGGTSQEITNVITESQISEFNSNFTKYEDKTNIRAQEIVSVANFAMKGNKQNEDDPRKYVYVVLRKTPGFNSNSFETKESEFIDFIKQYSLEPDNVTVINFKCSDVQINEETGMVNKIIFEKI
ncbi:MAG: hypothetical protein ACLU33_01670 [Christensenellales bacterium]